MATLLKHLEKRPLLKGPGRQWDVSNEKKRKKYGFDLYETKLFDQTNFMTRTKSFTSRIITESSTFTAELGLLTGSFSNLQNIFTEQNHVYEQEKPR